MTGQWPYTYTQFAAVTSVSLPITAAWKAWPHAIPSASSIRSTVCAFPNASGTLPSVWPRTPK